MANGAALDPTTLTGQVRLTIGDSTPDANGDYTFSDDAIATALALREDNVTRAVATLVKQLALQASLSGQSIKADDFSINTTGRGKDLLEVAKSYELEANEAEAAATAGELMVVNTSIRPFASEAIFPTQRVGLFGFPL